MIEVLRGETLPKTAVSLGAPAKALNVASIMSVGESYFQESG